MDSEIAVQVDAMLGRLQRAVVALPALAPRPAERRYEGPLTREQQVDGVRNALANVHDLLGDARTPLERGRYGRASPGRATRIPVDRMGRREVRGPMSILADSAVLPRDKTSSPLRTRYSPTWVV